MKNIVTALLLLATIAVYAKQNDVKINKSVDDNGKTMHVKIEVKKDGKKVKYDKTFDVKGMSKADKDALVNRICDSLGINNNVNPIKR